MKKSKILKKPKFSEEVTEWLRQAIISGAYEAGERLIETSIAEKLGISRVPVREAMKTLASEGVIVERQIRGYEVWTMTKECVDEILTLRFVLEALAYENVPDMLDHKKYESLCEQISEMKGSFNEKQYQFAVHHDRLFHENIIKLSGMQRVISFWTQIMTQWEMILNYGARFKIKFTGEKYEKIHKGILDALFEKNVEDAKRLLKLHIDYSRNQVKTVMNYLDKKD